MRLVCLSWFMTCALLCACDNESGGSDVPTDTTNTGDTTTQPTGTGDTTTQPTDDTSTGDDSSHDGGDQTGAPDPADAADALCGERPSGALSGEHVLRFEDADEGVTVQLRRAYAGPAAGESSLYDLQAFALRTDQLTHCITDSGLLSYMNSHHNWNDVATGHAEGVRYTLELTFDVTVQSWTPILTGQDDSGSVVFGPISLIPTGGPTVCFSCPNFTPVYISEVMTTNADTLEDDSGEFVPWIEICNPSAMDVPLGGWWLSNDLLERDRWELPAITLPRHECLVLFADGAPSKGERHTSFALTDDGGALVLTDPNGVTDGGFLFGPLPADHSLVWSWEHSAYRESDEPTPGSPDWDG